MRFRIRTIMIAVTILALIAALAVQTWRAERREAVLRARMQTMAEERDIALSVAARLSKVLKQGPSQLPRQVDPLEAAGRKQPARTSADTR
jgi:hypothetical protein